MTNESRINDGLTEGHDSLIRTLPRRSAEANREVGRSRLLVSDVLAKYSQDDGTIDPIHATAVLSEVAMIEQEVYGNLRDYVSRTATQTAEESAIGMVEILLLILGAKALTDFAGIPEDVLEVGMDVGTVVFGALTGMSLIEFANSIRNSVFNRRGEDGLVLTDRLRNLAGGLRMEVSDILRQSIRKGETVSDITSKIKRKFDEMAYRVKLIVETELMYAQRQVIARFAEVSGIATGLKIVDYPHGNPAEHARHKCYIYARADDHGLGRGVYPVSTRKIRNPHPQCRSSLHLVLADQLR